METGVVVGISIGIVSVLFICGILLYKQWEWKKKIFPQTFIKNMGIKYTQEATENWDGMELCVTILNSKLTSKYGAEFAADLLGRTWIEVVGANGARKTFSTEVSEKNHVAGSIDSTRLFPWSKKYWVAVVLQSPEYKTANDGAVFHEIVKHIVAYERGLGYNENHENAEMNALERDMHLAYSMKLKEMKAKK